MFDLSRSKKYKSHYSISDDKTEMILESLEEMGDGLHTVLDYGCHLGHLSIEMAYRYPVTIYAVDNFAGTPNSETYVKFNYDVMVESIREMTGGTGDFKYLLEHNISECVTDFIGTIIPMYSVDFFPFAEENDLTLDFAFIDSGHRPDDAWEFKAISNLMRVGGFTNWG